MHLQKKLLLQHRKSMQDPEARLPVLWHKYSAHNCLCITYWWGWRCNCEQTCL